GLSCSGKRQEGWNTSQWESLSATIEKPFRLRYEENPFNFRTITHLVVRAEQSRPTGKILFALATGAHILKPSFLEIAQAEKIEECGGRIVRSVEKANWIILSKFYREKDITMLFGGNKPQAAPYLRGIKRVTLQWLIDSVKRWEIQNPSVYERDPTNHLSPPLHLPEDPPIHLKQKDSDAQETEITPQINTESVVSRANQGFAEAPSCAFTPSSTHDLRTDTVITSPLVTSKAPSFASNEECCIENDQKFSNPIEGKPGSPPPLEISGNLIQGQGSLLPSLDKNIKRTHESNLLETPTAFQNRMDPPSKRLQTYTFPPLSQKPTYPMPSQWTVDEEEDTLIDMEDLSNFMVSQGY
ncbi:hypothetical protein IE077_003514, partial [Cardiosporidium cionae]